MIRNCIANFRKSAVLFVSIIILSVFILQIIAICPAEFFPSLKSLRAACRYRLWPFMDYSLYTAPHREGDKIERYAVFGTLEDSTDVPVKPEDLGLDFWLFDKGFVRALSGDDYEKVRQYADMYESRHDKRLVGLRLENHPLILLEEGAKPGGTEVLKKFSLPPSEEKER